MSHDGGGSSTSCGVVMVRRALKFRLGRPFEVEPTRPSEQPPTRIKNTMPKRNHATANESHEVAQARELKKLFDSVGGGTGSGDNFCSGLMISIPTLRT